MKIKITNTNTVGGTWLQSEIIAKYDSLVKLLGKPNSEGDADKVRAEWCIEINGKPITIYDWKDNTPLSKVTNWHIGSNQKVENEVMFLLKKLEEIKNKKETKYTTLNVYGNIVNIPSNGKLNDDQMWLLAQNAWDCDKYTPVKLSASQKKQFAEYMINAAEKYPNTHSMNRTILKAAIKQLTT